MNKNLIKVSVLVTFLSLGILTGCGPTECKHEGGHATCTELAVCTKCGEPYGDYSDHTFANNFTHNNAQHWKECYCGAKDELANHDFVAADIIKAPTCTEEGEQAYACVCGVTKIETLPTITHDYSNAYSFDEDQHWFECECGDKINSNDHEFVEGDIIKNSTCTDKGIQEYNCFCGATKEVELDTIPHKDEDLDIYCDYGCNKKIVPAYDTLLSCKTANALANAMISLTGNHYVQGEIVEVEDAKNGIFHIKDDSNETFKLRLVKGEGGIAYKDFECKLILGDYIKAYGKISRDTQSPFTPRMEGPIVTYIKQHDHVHAEATCLLPPTCECGHISGEPLGHKDTNADGLCDSCEFDLNNTVSTLNTFTKEGMIQVDENTLSWANDVVEFKVERGTSSQLYVDAQEHTRIYKGNVFSVFAKNEIVIKKLTFFTTATLYANGIITSLNALSVTGVIDGTNVVIEDFNSSSIVIPSTGSSIRITGIEIVYPKPVEEKEPTVVDFNTITTKETSGGDAKYTNSYTTASGWVTKNAAIQVGGSAVVNPAYPVIGPDNSYKAVCLNGKQGAAGTLTSPTLTGGLEEINVDYTKIFTDTLLSVTITVTELSTGNVYTHTISKELPKDEKYVVYSDSWKLDTPVKGDYTIVFTNDCPSNSTSNKDRMTLLKVEYK